MHRDIFGRFSVLTGYCDIVNVFLGQGICQTGYDGETCSQATEFHTTEQRSQIFAQHVSQKNSSRKLADSEVPPCNLIVFSFYLPHSRQDVKPWKTHAYIEVEVEYL